MFNNYELILEVLNENGKSIKDLENNKILAKNSFYVFSKTAPSLQILIKIANYLEVSIDYILNRTLENNFRPYKFEQKMFYKKLTDILKSLNVSQSKICKDLNISRTNFSRWKNGTQPSLTKLIAISNYLKCNIDDLLI